MKRDLYIRLLEFGDSNPNGFTYQHLNSSVKLNDEEVVIVNKYFDTMEAKFKYIDYLELRTALRNSKVATCIAIISILISIITTGISIHYSKLSLVHPVSIEKAQFETFREINTKVDTLIVRATNKTRK